MNKQKLDTGLFVDGNMGRIEALVTKPKQDRNLPLVIISHPHPLYGGSMENKVVTTLAKAFKELGHISVRFNFRGVGKSDGEYNGGVGETEDLTAIINLMQQHYPHRPIWLAGFSFGAYVVLRAHKHQAVHRVILIAPPVSHFNCQPFAPTDKPWTLIHGTQDELIPSHVIKSFASGFQHPPEVHFLDEASHFFHGRLNELRRLLKNIFGSIQPTPSAKLA